MKPFILSFVLILLSASCFSQSRDSINVQQSVYDSFTKHGIPGVFITLCDTNGIMIDTLRTQLLWGGKYARWEKTVARKSQAFLVKAEHPDYEPAVVRVEMKPFARQSDFMFPELHLKRQMKETTMQELTVKATRVQLTYKGDTIIVDAEAFKIPEGSMLDALVAQVPGAELKSDGTIYMNGRKVDYLTLNGKDFFKGNNRIMLDNLPYYVVSKLKFYEKDMPLSQRAHLETGEKDYVMDVEMKQEYSIGYTANVEAGAGTNDRWMGRLFGLRFTDNSRLVLFGNANNTNETRAPGGDNWEGKPKVMTGEKEVKMVGGSLNIEDKHKRYMEHLDASASWTGNKDETRTSRETFLSEGSVYERSNDASQNKDFNTSVTNNLEIPKITTTFKTKADYTKQDGEGLSRSATFTSNPAVFGTCLQILDSLFAPTLTADLKQIGLNQVLDQTKYGSTSYNIGQDIDFDRSLPWGDELSIKLSGDYGRENRDGFSRYNLTYVDPTRAQNKQDRYTPYQHDHYSYAADGQYCFHLYNAWSIYCGYKYSQKYDDSDNPLYRLDALRSNLDFGVLPSQTEYLQTIDASNSYQSQYTTKIHHALFAVRRNYNTESYLYLYGIVTDIYRKNESLHYWRSNNWYDKRQGNWLIEPLTYFECRPKETRKFGFKAHYNSQQEASNLVQMLNIKDTSNPLAITQGNPDLKVSTRHHLDLQLGRGKFGAYWWLETNLNFLDNLVANGFTYNPASGVYTYRPENVKGNWNSTTIGGFNRFLDKEKHLLVRSKTTYSYIHNVDLTRVEGSNTSQRSRVDHHITSQNITLSYNKESLRLEAIGDFAWNVAKRELDNTSDINAFDLSYGISGQYIFPWKIQLATDLKMYSRRGYEERSMNTNELVWNASVSRPFLKGKLVVKIDGFDILNQLSNTRYVVNGQGRTETRQLCMPRYAMLRVAYKFNKNPKKD